MDFAAEADRIRQIADGDPAFEAVPGAALGTGSEAMAAAADVDDFRLAAMRFMALAGNGHSRAIANDCVRVAPLRLVWLDDGPCVASPTALLGARLVAIGGVPVAAVFAAMRPFLAGTDQRARALAGMMLAWEPAVTAATGQPGPATYRLALTGGRRRNLRFGPDETVPGTSLYPASDPGAAAGLIAGGLDVDEDEARAGTFLRPLGRAGYLRIGDLSARPPAAMAALLEDFLHFLGRGQAVAIDLRGNPGGDFTGAVAFARRLAAVLRPPARVAVLVDKYTFSAALVTAALLKVHTGARLVGEEMGDAPRFWAEGGSERLPGSGLVIRHSDGWHDWQTGRPDPTRTPADIAAEMVAAGVLLPDIPVPLRSRDLAAGHDPVLAAARRLVDPP